MVDPSYLEPSIPEFYANLNIFITGGTGFIGKALIEKLLRSCPDIGKIYILIRPKRGKTIQERLELFLEEAVFGRIKQEQPNLKLNKKIIPVLGDMKQINLGLSEEDRKILTENVNIIFHVAASVRFDDPLREAVLMNVRGTREACQLALDAKNLFGFTHVSTAYANSDLQEAEEIFYPRKMDWRKLIAIAENFDPFTLSVLSEKLLGEMPNTYTFTKNIAENIAQDMLSGKIPCKIFRPSVVWCAMSEEPFIGWLDNFNGPTGLLVACGLGILQSVFSDPKIRNDYIPIDVCVKSIIVCTWDIAVRSLSLKSALPIEILHCSSYKADWLRFTAKNWSELCLKANNRYPLNDIIFVPSGHYTGNWYIWYPRTIFRMVLPAMIIDGILKLTGRKPRMLKVQKKMYVAQTTMKYFMHTNFEFSNKNLLKLQERIQQKDKNDFDYEFQNFDAGDYVQYAILGTRRYALKTPDSMLDDAKEHYRKLQLYTGIVYYVFWMIVFFVFFKYFF